jgi:NhaA family Na+:H+ antiporter
MPWHRFARRIAASVIGFFRVEAASGIVLFAAACAALVWANSPWGASYARLFAWPAALPLHLVVQEGLMTVFFFVVGMEVKRELVAGELRSLRSALLPAAAALGGMAAPAAIYALLNQGGPGARGWAIPMATDIAFCAGCLTLLGRHAPRALVVFLTALAIFDDLGGVLVIALFYGRTFSAPWLVVVAAVAGLVLLGNRKGLTHWIVYLAAGVALWVAMYESGVHPTIAGVLLGVLIPAGPADEAPVAGNGAGVVAGNGGGVIDRFIEALHPWVAFGVMPLFALSSAGVALGRMPLASLLSPVTLGAGLGLFLGKQAGIFLVAIAAIRAGLAPMPGDARPSQLYGVAVIGGIGFTVALFIAELAFPDAPALLAAAKVGIIGGSLLAGAFGSLVLRLAARP